MATKEDLVNHIKEWIKVDEEMKVLQKEMKERRKIKKELTEMLVEIMKTNEIDCFDITATGGNIVYTKNKVKAPLSKKYLLDCLDTFFKGIPDVEASEVTKYIMDHREEKITETIKHKKQKIHE